jgi:hypothetical protein
MGICLDHYLVLPHRILEITVLSLAENVEILEAPEKNCRHFSCYRGVDHINVTLIDQKRQGLQLLGQNITERYLIFGWRIHIWISTLGEFLRKRERTYEQITSNFSRWRLAAIHNVKNDLFVGDVNYGKIKSYVSTELPPLGVPTNGNLLLRVIEKENCQDGVACNKHQRQGGDFVVPLAEIFTCFVVAGLLLFFGVPEASIQGFIMTIAGLLSFTIGFVLILHLTENAWSADNGVSALCYSGPEDIEITAIIVSEFKFSKK